VRTTLNGNRRDDGALLQPDDTPQSQIRFADGTNALRPFALDDGEPTRSDGPCDVTADPGLDLSAIPDPVFLVDLDARLIGMNGLAESLVGYVRDDLLGCAIDTLIDNLEPAARGATRFVPASKGAHVHHRCGRRVPVEVLICPHEGASLLMVRSRRVDGSGLHDEDIVQIMHDIRNPLSTISLESQLLDTRLYRDDARDTSRAVERISLNVTFIDRMIQDLIDLCAIGADRLELRRVPTELGCLVEQVIDRAVATRDRGRVFCDPHPAITLEVDDLRIERVIANLVQNALKYAPASSGVILRIDATDRMVRVSVTDAGPGIDVAEHAAIFDKYHRAPNASSREGSGLGLFVSKRIIEAHGGRIGVESVRGEGSCFFFELPR